MRKKIKIICEKVRERTRKWGKIEEMFLSCPLGSERLATALIENVLIFQKMLDFSAPLEKK